MPNNQQPQGLTKVINNPVANDDGKIVIDFNMPEDNGIATASHLALLIDDGTARESIDLVFNPAILRTRFDSVHIEVVSNVATNIDIYVQTQPEHVTDYTQADKRTLAVEADKPQLLTVKKLDDVIVFDGADIDRLIVRPAPEAGDSTGIPTPNPESAPDQTTVR